MGSFERALKEVLEDEGGYVNHPKDKGRATNQGVTQAVYDDYRRSHDLAPRDVRGLRPEERDAIYRVRYWDLIKGGNLPEGLSYVVFDGAVNSGPARAVRWLQRALGVLADGVVGPQTLVAVKACADIAGLIDRICDIRVAYLKELSNFSTFGRGWLRRVAGVRATGKAWATGTNSPRYNLDRPESAAKALAEDAKPAPMLGPADAASGAGLGGGALAATLQQAQEQLAPHVGNSQVIATVVACLSIASALMIVGGFGWRWWAMRRRAAREEALS